jgi:hypothetical protein
MLLAAVPLYIRGSRLSVTATEQRVEVRNLVRTYTIPWDEIDSFSFGRPSCIVVRRDGVAISMSAIQPANITLMTGHHSAAETKVDQLNELLRSRRGEAP